MARRVWEAPNNMDNHNASEGTNSITCHEEQGGEGAPREGEGISRSINQNPWSPSLPRDKKYVCHLCFRVREDSA